MTDFTWKILTGEDEYKYKIRVYIDCLKMIKELFVFYDKTVIYKEYFDEQIDSFIDMFKDLIEEKRK